MRALRLTYSARSFVKQSLLWLMLALLVTWIVPASYGHAQVVAGAANSARVVDPPYGDQPPGENDPPPAYNDARMISQSVPTSVVAGQTYQVSITMQNTGTLPWSQSNKYLLAPQDGSYVWGTTRGELPSSPVLPGATMTIDFPMTAPSTPGTYLFQWRMVQEFVEWFGTPTTAVMVTVTAPPSNNNARMISQSVPTSVVAGQTYPVSITMQNTGTLPWNQSAKYILAPMDGSYVWGTTRGELPSSPVLPGATTTMNFPLTAPSTPGTYLFQWRMVQEFVEWFGTPTTAVMITVTQNLGNVTYIHTDGLGSPVARTDGAGNLISRTYYEPYGNTAAGAQPTIGFTGHVNDIDTGLTYMQQRYYDPVAGRFLSNDPVLTDVNTGNSFNRYAYSINNPYKYIDPDGRQITIFVIGKRPDAEQESIYPTPPASLAVGSNGGGDPIARKLVQIYNKASTSSPPPDDEDSVKSNKRGIGGRGWRDDKIWRDNVDKLSRGGTHENLGGKVPTRQEAIDALKEARARIDRIEGPHESPNPHNYDHINYTTENGIKGTVKITGLK